jgi:hypothetical protein
MVVEGRRDQEVIIVEESLGDGILEGETDWELWIVEE